MTTEMCNGDSETAIKRIKLEKEFSSDTKENDSNHSKKVTKIEPKLLNFSNNSSVQHTNNERSDMVLKVCPLINNSEKTNKVDLTNTKSSSNKSFHLYISSISNSTTKSSESKCKEENVKTNRVNHDNLCNLRPSEGLFVRCLLPYCKRLAPLWFKGVSSMREKNREEHRRISASAACQNQNDWEIISGVIKDMSASSETDTVVNLLKKLYKELPADSVLWFIKCWLNFSEAVEDENKCALSRGDVRGRMRRIDGGKGSDKVWRLDTIVGMMYHGMPMSSTDTNIMVHTCDEELCIRPQHLRFKASSVALVVVLKALQQTGYSIVPPPNETDIRSNLDEFVDVSGPFSIEELQKYRLEQLMPCEKSMGKLNSSSTDLTLLESYPILKDFYPTYSDEIKYCSKTRGKSRGSPYPSSNHSNQYNMKRPPQTTSNSTGSPPILDSSCSVNIQMTTTVNDPQQCHSPPLLGVKPQKFNIVPTPRKIVDSCTLSHAQLITSPNTNVNPQKRRHESIEIVDTKDDEGEAENEDIFLNNDIDRNNNKYSVPSPASTICFTHNDLYGQAPDLLPEEPSVTKIITVQHSLDEPLSKNQLTSNSPPALNLDSSTVNNTTSSNIINANSIVNKIPNSIQIQRPWSQMTNEDSPLGQSNVNVGNNSLTNTSCTNNGNISGKTTPRQPAKKRLEARTPTSFVPINNIESISTPPSSGATSDIKPSQINSSSISAFKKYNTINNSINDAIKTSDHESESEMDGLFDETEQYDVVNNDNISKTSKNSLITNNNNNNTHLMTDGDQSINCNKIRASPLQQADSRHIGNSNDIQRGSAVYGKAKYIDNVLTTPSPLDYLLMAISRQTPNFQMDMDSSSHNNQCSSPLGSSIDAKPQTKSLKTQSYLSGCSTSSSMMTSTPSTNMVTVNKQNKSNSSNNNNNNNNSSYNTLGCRFTPEQASVLLNAMRASPLGNNNPEIIDILYNMTQQYGFHPPISCNENGSCESSLRIDSVLLRKQIYQQLKSSPQFDPHETSLTPIISQDD